jgi:hypothetical protein
MNTMSTNIDSDIELTLKECEDLKDSLQVTIWIKENKKRCYFDTDFIVNKLENEQGINIIRQKAELYYDLVNNYYVCSVTRHKNDHLHTLTYAQMLIGIVEQKIKNYRKRTL